MLRFRASLISEGRSRSNVQHCVLRTQDDFLEASSISKIFRTWIQLGIVGLLEVLNNVSTRQRDRLAVQHDVTSKSFVPIGLDIGTHTFWTFDTMHELQ